MNPPLAAPQKFGRREFHREFNFNKQQSPGSLPPPDTRRSIPHTKKLAEQERAYDGFNVKDA